jgi:putative hydrolase of the HAD superfamily
MAPRIEAVVCDFGGVLTTPLFNAFAHVQEEQGIPMESLGKAMWAATQERGENPLFPLERGEMSEPEFLRVVGDALSREVGRPVEMEGFADRYWAQLSPNEEMVAYLRSLRERGVRLALLTNNVREWEPRWRPVWDIDSLFEVVVDSGFVGMRKPEPGIYALTLSRLGLPGEACVFVDDLELNCDAAREAGMHPVLFVSASDAIREVEALLTASGPRPQRGRG